MMVLMSPDGIVTTARQGLYGLTRSPAFATGITQSDFHSSE
jgi:hypothetical protein